MIDLDEKRIRELRIKVKELEHELQETRTGHETDMEALRFQAKRVDVAEAKLDKVREVFAYEPDDWYNEHYPSYLAYRTAVLAILDYAPPFSTRSPLNDEAKLDAVRAWAVGVGITTTIGVTITACEKAALLAILDGAERKGKTCH